MYVYMCIYIYILIPFGFWPVDFNEQGKVPGLKLFIM